MGVPITTTEEEESVQVTPMSKTSTQRQAEETHEAEKIANEPPVKLSMGGKASITFRSDGTSKAEHQGVDSIQTAELRQEGRGLLATAHSSFGATTRLAPDTLVTYKGQELTLETAEQLGLVTRKADGTYEEVSSQPAAISRDNTDQKDGPQMLDEKVEAELEGFYEKMGEREIDKTVNSVITDSSEIDYEALADMTGLSAEDAQEKVAGIYQAFEDQAVSWIEKEWSNVDGQEVLDYARENASPDLIARIAREHYYGAKLDGYTELVTFYLQNTAPNELPEGATTRVVDGEEMVTLPGKSEMLLRVAVKLGLL
jgi:hypothetical protein